MLKIFLVRLRFNSFVYPASILSLHSEPGHGAAVHRPSGYLTLSGFVLCCLTQYLVVAGRVSSGESPSAEPSCRAVKPRTLSGVSCDCDSGMPGTVPSVTWPASNDKKLKVFRVVRGFIAAILFPVPLVPVCFMGTIWPARGT